MADVQGNMEELLGSLNDLFGTFPFSSTKLNQSPAELQELCKRMIEISKRKETEVLDRRYRQLLSDVGHHSAETARKGSQLCDEVCDLQLCLDRLEEITNTPTTRTHSHDLYREAVQARDDLKDKRVKFAYELSELLRSRGNDLATKLNDYSKKLDCIKAILLLVWIALLHPDTILTYFIANRTLFQKDPLSVIDSRDFDEIHGNVFEHDLEENWDKLKEGARKRLIDATHIEKDIEKKFKFEVPEQLMDPLFDQLLFVFVDIKERIDILGERLDEGHSYPKSITVFQHLDFDRDFEELQADIETFEETVKDKTVYQEVFRNVMRKHHTSIGTYLINVYNRESKCPPKCSCGKRSHSKITEPVRKLQIAYAVDKELNTLQELPEEGKRLIRRIENRYKRALRWCRNSIRHIDHMLYGSEMTSYQREKMRYRAVTYRLVPFFTHTVNEIQSLKNPALRDLATRNVTANLVALHEAWLDEMKRQGAWAIDFVFKATSKAGRRREMAQTDLWELDCLYAGDSSEDSSSGAEEALGNGKRRTARRGKRGKKRGSKKNK